MYYIIYRMYFILLNDIVIHNYGNKPYLGKTWIYPGTKYIIENYFIVCIVKSKVGNSEYYHSRL